MTKSFLMGNQAFAHAALEAGVRVCAGYPGTPSSEVIETVAKLRDAGSAHDVYVEWSTNEKAALEMLAGAALCGARTLFTAKQVGLNVASDPLMSLNYIGVEGGTVLLVADDPGPISSQTEQDTRRFASFAKVPVFDPATPEQGCAMIAAAYDLSEKYHTPVIFRPSTRICHASTFVEVADETHAREPEGFESDPSKWVIFPGRSYRGHGEINERLPKIAADFSASPFNPWREVAGTDEGAKIFADMTSNNIGKTLGIYLDGEELLAPTVQSAITTGSGVITQMQSAEYAQTVAAQIQSGALPMELTQQKVDTVSATLGTDALSTSVLAAVIGLVLIMALMIFRYRLNGVVASWALCDYVIILFFLLAVIPGIQLTLPGLAGIVLGIGMAVDANVIIFERFNEELRAGRGIRTALRTGFKNAMSAILDANVTTLIAAIVLMFFGTGSIQGFAKTLLLGVVVSMLSAVVITRFLMKNIINLGVKDKRMFAKLPVAEEEQK